MLYQLSYKGMKIIYEDKNILIVKKPINICVHKNKTYDCNIKDYFESKLKIKLFILNRLDKDVSGIIILKKNKKDNIIIINKKYIVISFGKIFLKNICIPIKKNSNFIKNFLTNVNLEGKFCLTCTKLLKKNIYFSMMLVNIYTGRTHQIRKHLSFIGCPILGDKKYGSFFLNKLFKKKLPYLFFKEITFYDAYSKKIFIVKLNTPKKFYNGST
ncbi:pseudouridine synthase [Candidatus Vidania fulgoroideorum]